MGAENRKGVALDKRVSNQSNVQDLFGLTLHLIFSCFLSATAL